MEMTKGKKIIVANWKMNPATFAEARGIVAGVKRQVRKTRGIEVVVCPPSVYLSALVTKKKEILSFGAQNVFWQNGGSFTGEVSPEMLRALGVRYAIVGHAERRAFGESDEIVARKVGAVLREGLTAILCVGERERREDGAYLEFLKAQIKNSLAGVGRKFLSSLVVAYEPLWAIGKSFADAMKPHEMEVTGIFIRKVLAELFDKEGAFRVPILYGGSVSAENAGALLSEGRADGLLVGRESLSAESFDEILRAVHTA